MAEKKANKAAESGSKETKKPVERADKKETKSQPNAIVRFYRETVGELRKVNWPSRTEAFNLTGIVLIVLAVMSIFLGLIDAGALWLMNKVMGL